MQNIPTFVLPLASMMTLAFYVLIISYIIFTTIFYYHWQNYSTSSSASLQTYAAYFIISLPLLLIMWLSLASI